MRLKLIAFFVIFSQLCAFSFQAQAQTTPPQVTKAIFRFNFNRDIGNWATFGNGSAACITTEPELVKEGRGALKYKYEIGKGFQGILITTFAEGKMSNVRSLRFWVRPDHTTTLSFILSEKDGGRYAVSFHAIKDVWTQAEFSPGDFVLDEGKDAPKDPDGVLDLELVNTLALVDVSQTYPQSDAISKLFPVKIGSHMLLLDDCNFYDTYLPSASNIKNGEGSLDLFNRLQLNWVILGDMKIEMLKSDKPFEGAAIQAKYHQTKARITAISKRVSPGSIAQSKRLHLSVASEKEMKLLIQLEERNGGKYSTVVMIPAGSMKVDLDLPFANFKASDDSKDDNGRLDLDQVNQLLLLDASGIVDGADADNTLWLGNIKVSK